MRRALSSICPSTRLGLALLFAAMGCGCAQPTLADSGPEDSVPVVAARPTLSPAVAQRRAPEVAEAAGADRDAEPAEVAEPPAPPLPEPFAGQARVTVGELLAELEAVASEIESDPDVVADYEAFVEQFGLSADDQLFRDYVRVKLAFEATRDGGFWRLRWDVTNRKPNSDAIWAQWGKIKTMKEDVETATAECDELSALFAFVARGLGVDRIGLFWPVWNHVVAVWTVDGADGEPVRVVVPTSQIFLSAHDTLGTDGFDPRKQKTIYTYKRRDVRKSHRLPGGLARFFIRQARQHAHRPQSELQSMRNRRSSTLGGS